VLLKLFAFERNKKISSFIAKGNRFKICSRFRLTLKIPISEYHGDVVVNKLRCSLFTGLSFRFTWIYIVLGTCVRVSLNKKKRLSVNLSNVTIKKKEALLASFFRVMTVK